MINLKIKTISYNKMRYSTVGDYWMENHKNIQVRVNEMRDERAEFLVAFHEFVELILTRFRGIDWKDIDIFDKWYEKTHKQKGENEPGDDPRAPYHKEHVLATKIEKILCKELGLFWKQYNKIVYSSCK